MKAFFCFGFGQSSKASGGRKLVPTTALFQPFVFPTLRFRCRVAAAALPRIAAGLCCIFSPGRLRLDYTLPWREAQTGAAPKG
ncbi:hypothetical protein LLH00_03440 [bacterium]|nr:hypothetical protein [bacterium]